MSGASVGAGRRGPRGGTHRVLLEGLDGVRSGARAGRDGRRIGRGGRAGWQGGRAGGGARPRAAAARARPPAENHPAGGGARAARRARGQATDAGWTRAGVHLPIETGPEQTQPTSLAALPSSLLPSQTDHARAPTLPLTLTLTPSSALCLLTRALDSTGKGGRARWIGRCSAPCTWEGHRPLPDGLPARPHIDPVGPTQRRTTGDLSSPDLLLLTARVVRRAPGRAGRMPLSARGRSTPTTARQQPARSRPASESLAGRRRLRVCHGSPRAAPLPTLGSDRRRSTRADARTPS